MSRYRAYIRFIDKNFFAIIFNEKDNEIGDFQPRRIGDAHQDPQQGRYAESVRGRVLSESIRPRSVLHGKPRPVTGEEWRHYCAKVGLFCLPKMSFFIIYSYFI